MPNMKARGIAVFPHLNEPDTKFNEDGVYQTQLQLDPEASEKLITVLEKIRDDAYKAECKDKKKPKLKKADLPFTEETDEEGEPTGNYLFRFKLPAKTKRGLEQRPVLVDSKVQPMVENIGSGSQLLIEFDPYTWFVPALGVGMTLRLKGVQVLELVEYKGSARCSFEASEGFETASRVLSAKELTDFEATDF